MRRLLLVALLLTATGVAPASAMRERPLVGTIQHSTFGRVLTRPDGQALYYWTVESATGRCTAPARAPGSGRR